MVERLIELYNGEKGEIPCDVKWMLAFGLKAYSRMIRFKNFQHN